MVNAKKTTTIIAENMGQLAPSAILHTVLRSHVTQGHANPQSAKETRLYQAMLASIYVEPDTIIVTKMAVAAPNLAAWALARSPSNTETYPTHFSGDFYYLFDFSSRTCFHL